MKHFLKKIGLFLSPIAVFFISFGVWNHRYLAAPRVTNSYCLNEKLYRAPYDTLDVLAIGSSMTMINLNSEVLVNGLANPRFYNFGSWGFNIQDVYSFTELLVERYKPSIFIIVSNAVDFRPKDLEYDINEVRLYLKSSCRSLGYLNYLDLKYFIKKTMENRENMSAPDIYSSLFFDQWGGVALHKEGFEIRKYRWNHGLLFDQLLESNYVELEEICRVLNDRSTKLFFVLSPLREGLVDDNYRKSIKLHADRVRGIVESKGGTFVDTTLYKWEDKLFVDGTHLNADGGCRLSEILLQAIGEKK
ncbi:MAG: hypothetical protein PF904_20160 [Kiritimatiellae bacterium]|jgi:hypothetical protein|nr:hypothetical protein [Kiritimatiellia bacterium]